MPPPCSYPSVNLYLLFSHTPTCSYTCLHKESKELTEIMEPTAAAHYFVTFLGTGGMLGASDVVEMQKSLFMLTVQSNEITQRCQIMHANSKSIMTS